MFDNSDPSTYSFTFSNNATIGSKLTISGVVFEFVADGTAGNDLTKVERKLVMTNTAKALCEALEKHPITKDLIDQNMLSLDNNPTAGLRINYRTNLQR